MGFTDVVLGAYVAAVVASFVLASTPLRRTRNGLVAWLVLRALTLLGTVVLLAALAVDSAGGVRILFILLAVLLIACFPVGYVLGRSLHIQHSK
jgi:hypothetical protein